MVHPGCFWRSPVPVCIGFWVLIKCVSRGGLWPKFNNRRIAAHNNTWLPKYLTLTWIHAVRCSYDFVRWAYSWKCIYQTLRFPVRIKKKHFFLNLIFFMCGNLQRVSKHWGHVWLQVKSWRSAASFTIIHLHFFRKVEFRFISEDINTTGNSLNECGRVDNLRFIQFYFSSHGIDYNKTCAMWKDHKISSVCLTTCTPVQNMSLFAVTVTWCA